MNKIELLREAVAKWSKIAVGLEIDKRGNNCSLCKAYHPNCGVLEVCPVYSHTRHEQCKFTPWEKWRDHHDEDHRFKIGFRYFMGSMCGKCRELANKELMFLQMLLEKEKRKSKPKLDRNYLCGNCLRFNPVYTDDDLCVYCGYDMWVELRDFDDLGLQKWINSIAEARCISVEELKNRLLKREG